MTEDENKIMLSCKYTKNNLSQMRFVRGRIFYNQMDLE